MIMEWDVNRHALYAGDMDDAHQLSVLLIRQLALASDEDELARLEQLRFHCEEHFQQEESWMDGAFFPSPEPHLQEHAAIHAALISARARLQAGQHGAGRTLSRELFEWFDRHYATHDAALAFCMLQARHPAGPGIPAIGA